MRLPLLIALCAAALVTAAPALAAEIGANDDTGKYAVDGGAIFFPQMASVGLRQSVMTARFDPADPLSIADGAVLDRAVPIAMLAGLEVSLAVYPYPPRDIESGLATPAAFAEWVERVARRYSGVKQFIVMNEPNQPAFLRPQFGPDGRNVSAATAGRYLAAAYDALKSVDPAITVVGLGLSPRGNDRPTAPSNISTSPVRFLEALGAWYRSSGRTLPLMDGLSFHPYPNQATDPLDRGYPWPNAGFADLGRIEQALWDAFRETPQRTTVNGLQLYLDEVGWQVDTSTLPGYTGAENVAVTDDASQAEVYAGLVRAVACNPHVAELNFFGFYDDSVRGGFQAALNRVDGTPRLSAEAVRAAIAAMPTDCLGAPLEPWYPAKRVIGSIPPTWTIQARRTIRFEATSSEGALVVACLLPRRLGGVAAAAAMALMTPKSPGCQSGLSLPGRPVRFRFVRSGPLQPATIAMRLVAEASPKRSVTYSRTLI